MAARGVLRTIEGGSLGFWCAGCEKMHVVGPAWTFKCSAITVLRYIGPDAGEVQRGGDMLFSCPATP